MAVQARTPTKAASKRPKMARPANGNGDGTRLKKVDAKPIAAVERALQVLSAFCIGPRLSLSELSNQTGLFKSTLLRILSTLERNGFVTRLSDGQYRVGGIVYELGANYASSFDLSEIIKPALADLSRLTGETAGFYVRSGTQRQCVFRVQSSQAVRHVIDAGQIVDLDGAATSQLLRRHEANPERPTNATDYASLCLATSGIGDSQTASVAAPIFDTGGFVGVINVTGPVNRFNASVSASCLAVLALVARKVTTSLGGFRA
jgi:DNA-binding IclR family transcriptional regulator